MNQKERNGLQDIIDKARHHRSHRRARQGTHACR